MAIFKKERNEEEKTTFNVKEVFILTTEIISNYATQKNNGIRTLVTWFYLATKGKDDEYYELFSGLKIEDEKKIHNEKKMETPYIKKVEPLSAYFGDSGGKPIEIEALMQFFVNLNIIYLFEITNNK